jgi:hypothetical protein
MCTAVEYLVNGEAQLGYSDTKAELPVRLRGGRIKFFPWGSASDLHHTDNTPGWLGKFPEGSHASLESIRANAWMRFEPDPVRIVASRFLMVDRWQVPRFFALAVGEFIQGLVAHIQHYERLYVVTVPTPAEHVEEFPGAYPGWPRIVSMRMRNPVRNQPV